MGDDLDSTATSTDGGGEGTMQPSGAGNETQPAEESNATQEAKEPAVDPAASSNPPLGLKGLLRKAGRKVMVANQFFVAEKRTLNFSNGDKYSGDFDVTHAR
jgi:hypothetical protein